MAVIEKGYTFAPTQLIYASAHNTNFDTLYNWANGNIDNANIKSGAAISLSKLSLSDDITMTGDWNFTSAATTDDMLTLTGSSLTTGSALKVYSNSASTSTRNLVEIINDHADADDTVCLLIQQDGADYAIDCGATGKIRGEGTDITWAGKSQQVVYTQTGAYNSGTTVMPADDTIPQITEGDEYMTRTITPTSATNILKIDVVAHLCEATNVTQEIVGALFQDTTADALAAGMINVTGDVPDAPDPLVFTHYMVAGTTSETTFRFRAGVADAGTCEFNGGNGGRLLGGVLASSLTVTEIGV